MGITSLRFPQNTLLRIGQIFLARPMGRTAVFSRRVRPSHLIDELRSVVTIITGWQQAGTVRVRRCIVQRSIKGKCGEEYAHAL